MTVAGDVRAFLAAARKELQIIRRYPLNYVGGLFWGALLPAVYVLMGQAYSGGSDPRAMRAFAERAGTTEFAGFVFIGYAMYMWLSSVLWGPGTSLRREQIQGSLEATMLTPVSRLILLFGPGMSAIPSMLFTFVVTFVTLWIMFGFVPPLGSLFPVVIIVLVAVPAMYAIGTLFAAGVLRYGEIGPVVQIVRGTFVLACGITFPVAMLPSSTGMRGRLSCWKTLYCEPPIQPATAAAIVTSRPSSQTRKPWRPPSKRAIRPAT